MTSSNTPDYTAAEREAASGVALEGQPPAPVGGARDDDSRSIDVGEWFAERAADVRAFDGVTWAVLAITAIAGVLHLWDLGARAYHHDEAQHAAFSYYFATGLGYRHDPLLHGPLNFDLIALMFKLFGDSDYTGRLAHALAGTALVATPLLLRRQLGNLGTIACAVFLTMSPTILYYARWAREDIFIALLTALIFAAVWRYRTDAVPQKRWLVVLTAAIALSYATKESIYLTGAVLLLYLDAALAHRMYWSRPESAGSSLGQQLRGALWLLPTAWIFAALWQPLARQRARLGIADERPREADLLVVVGTLVAPTLAAAVRIPLHVVGVSIGEESERVVAAAVILVLLAGVTVVGYLWRWDWWLTIATVFLVLTVPLYMTFGAHLPGVAGLFWNSLDYWLDQQEVRRGTQPWFYYFMMVPLYEAFTLLLAATGGVWLALRRRDHFAAMTLWWFTGTFIALSVAGEKMPWLTVHLALPLVFLGAHVVQRLVPPAIAHVRAGTGSMLAWAGSGFALAIFGLFFLLALYTDYGLNIEHPDTPVEPLIYVQTTPEVAPLAARIQQHVAEGRAQRIVVDDTEGHGITWPWAWYLRHDSPAYAVAGEIEAAVPPDAVVITLRDLAALGADGEVERYRHRAWFPEELYRDLTWSGLWDGLRTGRLPNAWAYFVVHHIRDDATVSLDGQVLFPR